VCVDLFLGGADGMGSEVAFAARFAIACRLGPHAARAEVSLADRAPLTVRFAGVAAGRHPLACTLDADGRITERDERDNVTTGAVPVLAGAADWRYGAAIRRAAPVARFVPASGETGGPPHYALELVIANTGVHPLRAFEIDCTGPSPSFSFRGSAGNSLPEHPVRTGELSSTLPPPGPVALLCTLRVTSPTEPRLAPVTARVTVRLPPP
jgi:hypothetical protein